MPQFKVTFGNTPNKSKKKISAERKEDLPASVVKAFGFLGDIVLQEKDSDDEWLDVDDYEELKDGASLKVIIKPLAVPHPTTNVEKDKENAVPVQLPVIDVGDNEDEEVETEDAEVLEEDDDMLTTMSATIANMPKFHIPGKTSTPKMLPVSAMSGNRQPSRKPTSSDRPGGSKDGIDESGDSSIGDLTCLDSSDNVPERRWSSPYRITDGMFNHKTLALLNSKKPLNKNQKSDSDVFRQLFEDITEITYYPTGAQYTEVISALLMKWVHLKGRNLDGCSDQDAVFSWKESLKSYFRNSRKRDCRGNPLVQKQIAKSVVAKAKAKSKKAKTAFISSQPNVWGVKHFCPDSVVGETEESVAKHHKVLQEQYEIRASARSATLIKLGMDKTFAERRQYITKTSRPIGDIKERYPLMFSWKGFNEEFERITEFNLMQRVKDKLAQYEERICDLTPLLKEDEMATTMRTLARSSQDPEEISYHKKCASLYIISGQLGESFRNLYFNPEKPKRSPQLAPKRDTATEETVFDIIMEEELMMSVTGFLEAVVGLLAVFYVLNVEYPPDLKLTFSFIQHALLRIEDGLKKENRVRTFMAKLNE